VSPIWGGTGQVLRNLAAPPLSFVGGLPRCRIFPAPERIALLPVWNGIPSLEAFGIWEPEAVSPAFCRTESEGIRSAPPGLFQIGNLLMDAPRGDMWGTKKPSQVVGRVCIVFARSCYHNDTGRAFGQYIRFPFLSQRTDPSKGMLRRYPRFLYSERVRVYPQIYLLSIRIKDTRLPLAPSYYLSPTCQTLSGYPNAKQCFGACLRPTLWDEWI